MTYTNPYTRHITNDSELVDALLGYFDQLTEDNDVFLVIQAKGFDLDLLLALADKARELGHTPDS